MDGSKATILFGNASRYKYFHCSSHLKMGNCFYHQIVSIWPNLQSVQQEAANKVIYLFIWNNKFILVEEKPIYYKKNNND
jgi:hypothetical protein